MEYSAADHGGLEPVAAGQYTTTTSSVPMQAVSAPYDAPELAVPFNKTENSPKSAPYDAPELAVPFNKPENSPKIDNATAQTTVTNEPSNENSSRRSRKILIIVIALLVVVIVGLGVGLGVALGRKHKGMGSYDFQ
jgi:hypothetical protein